MAGLPRAAAPMVPFLSYRIRLAPFLAFLLVAAAIPAAAQVTVAVGANPSAIAVNARTNRVYVANEGSDSVTVIDGNKREVVFVNLVGNIQPEQIATIGKRLNIDPLAKMTMTLDRKGA